MNKDNQFYYQLLSHIQSKLQTEIGIANPRALQIFNLSADSTKNLFKIAPELTKETGFLVGYLAQMGSMIQPQLNQELTQALAELYLSSLSEKEFFYLKEGYPFDWKVFEKNLNLDFARQVVSKAITG